MANKKTHTFAPKKSDAKKSKEAIKSKTKSTNPKQNSRKNRNEFGDEDAI